jgi:hypothetical protein
MQSFITPSTKLKLIYYNPTVLGVTVVMNLGLDYLNKKKIGKLQIIDIKPNIKKVSINYINANNMVIKKYSVDDFMITILFSCILGPLTTFSYMYDIYTNYKIKKTYILN